MSERHRVLLGTGYVLASTIAAIASSIAFRLVLVFFLGIADYGVFVLAVSLLSLFALVSDLGFSSALPKFVAEQADEERRKDLIAVAAVASGLTGLFTTLLLLAFAFPLGSSFGMPALPTVLVILSFQAPISLAALTLLAAINGLRRMRLYSAIVVFMNVSSLAVVFFALALGGGLVGAVTATVASSAVHFVVLAFIARGHLPWRRIPRFWNQARTLLAFGIKMSATNWTSTVLYQVDVILLAYFTRSSVLVAYYSIATLLGRILWIVPGSLSVVAYPAISGYAKEGAQSRIAGLVSRGLRFSAGFVGMGVLVIVYFGPEILRTLFGSAALPAYAPLAILLIGMAPLGGTKSLASGISSVGRPDIGLKIALAGLSISVTLNVLLIPVLGLPGAALATAIAYATTSILLFHYIQRTLKVPLDRMWFLRLSALVGVLALPGPFLASIATGVDWVRWTLGVASLGFLAFLLYARFLAKEDTAFLKASLREAIRGPLPP